jgi:shikimate dehydrogenase
MSADLTRRSGRRCCVVGSPISHSLSPVLHTAAYRELGLDWEYTAVELAEGELAPFVEGLDESWRGISVTAPLKREAYQSVDDVADRFAQDLHVVNTILRADDEMSTHGYNTDIDGLRGALRSNDVEFVGEIIVVGGGATAASALAAVRDLGALRATILVREPERARFAVGIARDYGLDATVLRLADVDEAPSAHVLISTIPAAAQEPYAGALVDRARVVFDVVYDPARTPLLEAAEHAGKSTIGGFDMLLHQAARQVELMTGCEDVPIAAMRKEGLAALGNR